MAISLFRYSGNKGRMFGDYRKPPPETRRIVEPYLGSGAYTLNCLAAGLAASGLGFDNDPHVVNLWHWLQSLNDSDDELDRVIEALELARAKTLKPDVRKLGLDHGAMLYAKINVCGLVVGQWSSWGAYPQHRLPVSDTRAALPWARQIAVNHGTAEGYVEEPGDVLFIDPPYLGTTGNYSTEDGYNPQETRDLISRVKCPIIFTYGDGADSTFPGLPWEVVKVRRVPNFRNGGTVERREMVAYLNWPPPEPDILDIMRQP